MKAYRLKEIKDFLEVKGFASLTELCDVFKVSLNTIRRDISTLRSENFILKVYGGVVLKQEKKVVPYDFRSMQYVQEKINISKLASRFLEKNETIFLDSGTTTIHLLQYIKPEMNINIISNSLIVYMEAQKFPNLNIISVGGLYYHKTNSFIGFAAINRLNEYRIDKAFMAASGVSIEHGAANNSFHEADIKQMVIKQSKKVILTVDHTKLDKSASISFCSLDSLYAFVTDKKPPENYLDFFSKNGIQIIY